VPGVLRSTGAEPSATRFHRGEETLTLPAIVPRTMLAIPWSRLITNPGVWWGASLLASSVDAPTERLIKPTSFWSRSQEDSTRMGVVWGNRRVRMACC